MNALNDLIKRRERLHVCIKSLSNTLDRLGKCTTTGEWAGLFVGFEGCKPALVFDCIEPDQKDRFSHMVADFLEDAKDELRGIDHQFSTIEKWLELNP